VHWIVQTSDSGYGLNDVWPDQSRDSSGRESIPGRTWNTVVKNKKPFSRNWEGNQHYRTLMFVDDLCRQFSAAALTRGRMESHVHFSIN